MLKPFDMSEANEYDAYLAYLNSKTWADKRNLALERDSYKCSICGNPNNLQVHHLCYPRTLGTEPISDLMTLCEHCHKDLEAYKKGHRYDKRDKRWAERLTLDLRVQKIITSMNY